jgi:hypothetical protein
VPQPAAQGPQQRLALGRPQPAQAGQPALRQYGHRGRLAAQGQVGQVIVGEDRSLVQGRAGGELGELYRGGHLLPAERGGDHRATAAQRLG